TLPHEIHHEYWIGHSLSHQNLARSHSLHYDNDSSAWVMEMDHVPFPLLDLLDHDTWQGREWGFEEVSCLFRQVLDAVAYMHSRGLAHRDLKIENIMVARNGVVKVIDFGSAAASRDLLQTSDICKNWVGTPITMAPETHGESFYDLEAADVWSLGIIFVRLWLGVYPW
ncbi:kinase-like protein, partial [Lindgomyces ingoldianus]